MNVPRPTYQQFITDNAIAEEWWHNRLRLLQLIGGSHGAASAYDVPTILQRLEPFEQELVPEMIILDGRQARHSQALRLLTHGLGDYDTAINYCLLGGSSIFYPSSSIIPKEAIPSRQDQTKLFDALLLEFLQIEDFTDRVEQTGDLLDRFGGWFDTGRVSLSASFLRLIQPLRLAYQLAGVEPDTRLVVRRAGLGLSCERVASATAGTK